MPISLGDAILYFRGDTSGLDAASKEALKSVDDMSKKMAEAARGVGIAFAAMGASITAGVGFALKAFGESDAAARQLDAVLKSTGGAAGMTAEAVKGLAAELSKLTGIDDDVIVTGQNMLLTFTEIGKDVFPDATKALIDMATAMNGGTTPSAEQLKDTAIQLGKALNNPVEGMAALQRVGVRLSEEQKAQVKAFAAVNDVAGAQRVILAELTKEFGGSAASAAASFGGKINELKTNFGNLLEVLGSSVAPLIGKMAAALGDAAQKAQAFAETHPELTKWGVAITGALGATMLALSPVLIAMPNLVASVKMLIAYGPQLAAFFTGPAGVVALTAVAAVSVWKLADAWKGANDAQKGAADTWARLDTQVKKLAQTLEANGVAVDRNKLAQLDAGKAMEYLNGLEKERADGILASTGAMEEHTTKTVEYSEEMLKDLEKINDSFASKLAETDQKQANHIEEALQKEAEADRDFKESLAEQAYQYSLSVEKAADDTAKALQDIEYNWQKTLSSFYESEYDAQQDYADRRSDAAVDRANASADIMRNAADKRKELQEQLDATEDSDNRAKIQKQIDTLDKETQRKLSELNRDYLIKQQRDEREFQQDRERAARKLAAEEAEFQRRYMMEQERAAQMAAIAEERYKHERDISIRENQERVQAVLQTEQNHNRDMAQEDVRRGEDYAKAVNELVDKYGLSEETRDKLLQEHGNQRLMDNEGFAKAMADKHEEQADRSTSLWGLFWDFAQTPDGAAKIRDALQANNDAAQKMADDQGQAAEQAQTWWQKAWDYIKGIFANISDNAPQGFNQGGFSGGYAFAEGGTVQGSGGQVPIIANEEGPELARTPDGKEGIIGNGLPGLFMMPVGSVISTASETAAKLFRSFADGGVVGTGMDSNIISQLGRMREAFVRLLGRAGADGRLDILDAQAAQADVQSGWERIVSWATDAAGLSSVTGTKENGSHTMALDRNGSYGIYHRFGGDGSTDYYLDGLEAYAKGGPVKDTRSKVDESKRSIVMQKFADALYRNYGSFPFDTSKFMDWAARIAAGWTSIDRQYGSDGKITGYGGAQGANTFGLVRGADGIGSVSWGQRGALERLKIPGVEAFAAGGRVNGAGGVTLNVNVGALHVREEADIQRVSREIARQMKSSLLGVYA